MKRIRKFFFTVSVFIIFSINIAYADSYDGPEETTIKAITCAKDEIVNVRKGADSKFEIVGTISNDKVVDVYGSILNKKKQKWYYISFDDIKGWTHESNINVKE